MHLHPQQSCILSTQDARLKLDTHDPVCGGSLTAFCCGMGALHISMEAVPGSFCCRQEELGVAQSNGEEKDFERGSGARSRWEFWDDLEIWRKTLVVQNSL